MAEEGTSRCARRISFLIAMIGAVSLFCWQGTQGAKPKDEMLELYGLFVDAVEKVETNYVRPVSRRELLESALEGMLQNLDPHSSFINTSEWKTFRRQIEGKFGGIGIQVEVDAENGRLRVIAPMVGTPGLRGGDSGGRPDHGDRRQVGRRDEPGQGRRSSDRPARHRRQAQRLARGFRRARDDLAQPAIIDIPSVLGDRRKPDDQWDFMIDKDKKIGYIRVTSFNQNTADELKKALDQLKEEGGKGLILDLRDDPGGLLSSAVEVSDMFLDKGEIVSTKGRNTQPQAV